MHEDFNTPVVTSTLREIVKFLEKNNIEYRFLGSVVITAINGGLHRNLGDLDLVIDNKGHDALYKHLKHLGFKPASGMFAFARKYLGLEQFTHDTLLGIGYFCGTFKRDGSFVIGNNNTHISVDAFALEKTQYTLEDIHFIGIPQRAAAAGVKESASNPKRKKEITILKERDIKPFKNNYIHVQIYGMKADWMYHFAMTILNIIGVIRVKLGLAFDPWR